MRSRIIKFPFPILDRHPFILHDNSLVLVEVIDILHRQRIVLLIGIQRPPALLTQQGAIHTEILTYPILIAPFIVLDANKVPLQAINPPGALFAVILIDTLLLIPGLPPDLVVMVYPPALSPVL